MRTQEIKSLLRKHGMRATSARIEVITFLHTQPHPIGISVIEKVIPDVNQATLYRMMDRFVEVGIVTAHHIGHGHADYELTDRPPHHHVICKTCDKIRDLPCTETNASELDIAEFARIDSHQTTYYGTCVECADKKAG